MLRSHLRTSTATLQISIAATTVTWTRRTIIRLIMWRLRRMCHRSIWVCRGIVRALLLWRPLGRIACTGFIILIVTLSLILVIEWRLKRSWRLVAWGWTYSHIRSIFSRGLIRRKCILWIRSLRLERGLRSSSMNRSKIRVRSINHLRSSYSTRWAHFRFKNIMLHHICIN